MLNKDGILVYSTFTFIKG